MQGSSELAAKAKGQVAKDLPYLLRYMRRNSVPCLATFDGSQCETLVLWHPDWAPRIFLFPEVELLDHPHFVINCYDMHGGQVIFDTVETLWFKPDHVADLKELLLEALVRY